MKEAIIGLIGVFIGGLIGIVAQFISSYFDYKKWRKEKSIEILKSKKENLESKFEKYKNKLIEGIKKNSYDAEMYFEFMYIFPKNVFDAFDKMVSDKNKDFETKKSNYHDVVAAIKEAISDIDKKIKEEINDWW